MATGRNLGSLALKGGGEGRVGEGKRKSGARAMV